jgi:hypothetical protein
LYPQNSRIKVFRNETGDDSELLFNGVDNVFAVSELPKTLWVQGHLPSANMLDTSLTLKHDSGAQDKVKFTVLWVTIDLKSSAADTVKGTITAAGDNNKKEVYKNERVPPSYALGPGVFLGGHAWGVLTTGTVDPHDFPYLVNLERNVQGRIYRDNLWSLMVNFPTDPNQIPGNDTSPGACQDLDPQSDTSDGHVYDWDAPFLNTNPSHPVGTVLRNRANYRAFAAYDGIRASEVTKWFTAQSYRKTATGWISDPANADDHKTGVGGPILLSDLLGHPSITGIDPAVIDKSDNPGGSVIIKVTGANFVDAPTIRLKKGSQTKVTTLVSGRTDEVRVMLTGLATMDNGQWTLELANPDGSTPATTTLSVQE